MLKHKMELIGDYKMPHWAPHYLEYGEDDGLTEQDIAQIEGFLQSNFYDHGYGNLTFSWGDDMTEFCRSPAFGLAGPVIDCRITGEKIAS